ncbi:MAG: ExbD/TolR family protein [Roseimicrobium sp.]
MNLRRRHRPSPVIPIVALVDILVIVLLFVVATTTFRKRKTEMKVNLPKAENLGQAGPAQDTRKSLTITKDKKFVLDGREIAQADLVAALKELRAVTPDAKLEVVPDGEAPHGLWVAALDALVASGFASDVTSLVERAVEGANPR